MFYGQTSLVGNHGRRVLRAKEEGDLPACYQRSVQKPASLMVWGGGGHKCIRYGQLAFLEGTMNAERYIKILEQHMLPSRGRALFLMLIHVFLQCTEVFGVLIKVYWSCCFLNSVLSS